MKLLRKKAFISGVYHKWSDSKAEDFIEEVAQGKLCTSCHVPLLTE